MSGKRAGVDLVWTAVDRFHRLVLGDHRLGPRFVETDVTFLKAHLSEALARALRGEERSWPAELTAACRNLGLTEDDWDRLGHHLLSTLLSMRVGPVVLVRVGAALTEARGRPFGAPDPDWPAALLGSAEGACGDGGAPLTSEPFAAGLRAVGLTGWITHPWGRR